MQGYLGQGTPCDCFGYETVLFVMVGVAALLERQFGACIAMRGARSFGFRGLVLDHFHWRCCRVSASANVAASQMVSARLRFKVES